MDFEPLMGDWHKSPRRSGKLRYSLCDCYIESKLNWERFKEESKHPEYPESYTVKKTDKHGKVSEVPFWRPAEIDKFWDAYWKSKLGSEQDEF